MGLSRYFSAQFPLVQKEVASISEECLGISKLYAYFFTVYLLCIPSNFPWDSLTLKSFCPDMNKLTQELFHHCVPANSCYEGTTKPPDLMKLSKARNPFIILATATSKCVFLLEHDKINTSNKTEAEELREIEWFYLHWIEDIYIYF